MGKFTAQEAHRGKVVRYTIDQLLLKRLNGWKAAEWIFLPMRDFPFLRDQHTVEIAEHYAGFHGMSVVIVCDKDTANKAYREGDKLLVSGLLNLAVWHIGLPHIAELVFHGHRYQTPRVLPVEPEWADSIKRLAGAK